MLRGIRDPDGTANKASLLKSFRLGLPLSNQLCYSVRSVLSFPPWQMRKWMLRDLNHRIQ